MEWIKQSRDYAFGYMGQADLPGLGSKDFKEADKEKQSLRWVMMIGIREPPQRQTAEPA